MTNDGDDKDRAAYLARIASGPEEVRLIKLCDLIENMASCAYGIPDMGLEWMRALFLPIASQTAATLRGATYADYPRTAELLCQQMDFQLRQVRQHITMYLSAAPPTDEPATRAEPRKPIMAESWAKALEETREEERKRAAELFKRGRPFPIPTPKDD